MKYITFIVLLVIACIIFGPLLGIWSLNALFPVAIPYTFKTWFAMLIVMGAVKGSSSSGSSK